MAKIPASALPSRPSPPLFNTPRDPDYAAGWNARLDGKQRVDNPHASPIYENDYGRRLAWLFGWDDADYAIRCAEES